MTGILCLFEDAYAASARDSEKFVNPNISSVQVNIDGMRNKLYSKGMVASDFWESVKKRFGSEGINQLDFYTNDKFALWIDLRTFPDDTRDGVKLEIKRRVGGSGNITCFIFVVSDALMEIMGGNLKSIMY